MVKPIGVSKSAFDATQDSTFYFTSNGGNQVVKNKIIIRNNETNESVYEYTLESYSFNQTVPKNTLTNGTYYNFSFITYDIDDNASNESSPIAFYCYTTPQIIFVNLTEGQKIRNASYDFELKYTQNEGELLDFLKLYLYDSNENLIDESENLYSTDTPPITFLYLFEGLEDNTPYKIQAKARSINGTISQSDLISFIVIYESSVLHSNLTLENKCNDGYNQITTSMILIDGECDNPNYVDDNTKLSLLGKENVIWKQGYSIDRDFILQLWYEIGMTGKIFRLTSETKEGNYFIGKSIREIPYGETTPKDYVEVIGYINNVETFYMRSNYIDITNNTTYLILWFKFNPNNATYELILEKNGQVDNHIYWNDNSNVEYGRLTNIQYDDETYGQGIEKNNIYGDMSSIFPITSTQLYNGVYDNIDITCNISKQYSTDIPTQWDNCTILDCDFNGNLNGGDVSIVLNQISSIKIKAREYGEFNWVTLKDKLVEKASDLNFTFNDYRCPSFSKIEYAIVPMIGGAEGNYISDTLDTIWNKVFISDEDTTLELNVNVTYDSFTSQYSVGNLIPINSKYPIVIQNSDNDYISGTISGTILNKDFVNKLDRPQIVALITKWNNFLKNDKTKVIKDWNGNIWIGKIINPPTLSYSNVMGNGFGNISFSFVEQGKWNVQEDLYNNNLTNVE